MDWKIKYGPPTKVGYIAYVACENIGETIIYFSTWHSKPPRDLSSIVAVFKLKGTK